MRRVLLFIAFVLCLRANANAQSSKPASKPQDTQPAATISPSPAALQAARASFARLPLSFEENVGQTDGRVKFSSRGAGYNLFLTADEAVFALRGGSTSLNCAGLAEKFHSECADPSKSRPEESVLWLKMLGANVSAPVAGTDPLPGKINYYIGNEPAKWRTGVRQFGRVNYRGIYPGVDLTYYGNQQQLESDFVVAPGADPRSIQFEVKGARETRIDAQGNLVLITSVGNVQLLRPAIYQEIKGVRHEVSGRYVLRSQNRVAFSVGPYDRHEKLIIDPTLIYATYLGGSGGDGAQAIAVDALGRAYVAGQGASFDFPGSDLSGPPNQSLTNFAFVTVLAANGSSGTQLFYSTILAGSLTDFESTIANGIGVDSAGNAYVAGVTGSSNFPMVNPFQSTFGGAMQTGFVAGLKSDGTLSYSTYLGGRNGPGGGQGDSSILQGLFADSTGNAYVVGRTTSENFPTVNPFQSTLRVAFPNIGETNVVVAKLNPQGQPLYSTYLNGTGSNDLGMAIAADALGNAYVTGQTVSTTFPIQASPTPIQNALKSASADVFVTKLSFSGSALSVAGGTYLGGSSLDEGMAIAVDTATPPNVYVTGQTLSSGTGTSAFPTKGPISGPGAYSGATNAGGTDVFVTKISGDFTTLMYSTYLGGIGTDIGYGIALDGASPPNAYVTGSTSSSNFPLVNSLQAALGSVTATNAFVAEINGAGSLLTYSTYLGGISSDVAHGIAVDSIANAYVAGRTLSANFPVVSGGAAGTSPFQGQLGSSQGNAFVAKISPTVPPVALNFFPPSYNFHTVGLGGTIGFATETVTLTNNTGVSVSGITFTVGGTNPGDFSVQSAAAPCSSTAPFTLAAAPAANSSCTIVIRFTPTDQDARSGQISMNSTQASSTVLNLTGTGGVPEVSFSPATVSFFPSPDPLNFQAGASVTVTNSGGGPLTIGSAQIQAADAANLAPFSLGSGCVGLTINPGGSCSIGIFFVPTVAGSFSATLLLNTNAAGSPQTFSFSGTSVAEVLVQPKSLEFGLQVVNSTSTNNANEFGVLNGSGVPITLTLTPGTAASQGDFHIDNSLGLTTCANNMILAPGQICTTFLYFQPTAVSATDGRTGNYTVGYTGTAVPSVVPGSQVVNLMGTGVTGIFLLTNPINFGNEFVGFTLGSPLPEALYNGTSSPITVNVTMAGNNPGDFTAPLDSTCAPGGVVPALTYCRVSPTFTPSALGARSATASFDYTGDLGVPLLLNLSGTGIPGPVVITANGHQTTSFDFGSEIISTTTPEMKFVVHNEATAQLSIQSISAPGNTDFKITPDSTCVGGGTVPAGGNCFIGVTYTPSTNDKTKKTTTFILTDAYTSTGGADSSSPHTLTISGTGEPAVITVSVSTTVSGASQSLLDFGNVPVNPASLSLAIPQAEVFLTNAGNTPTTITWAGGSPVLNTLGTDFSPVTSGTNPTTCTQNRVVVAQGGNCQITVQFNPTKSGEQTNSVTFTDSVGGSHTVQIQGNGVGQGLLSLSATTPVLTFSSLSFNQLLNTTSSAQTVTVYNLGNGPLTITNLPTFGTNTSNFNILPASTCKIGAVIASGSTGNSCVLNITFTAPGTAGFSNAELEVQANLGNNTAGTVFISLSGTAAAGGISISPASPINFGAVAVGSTSSNSLTLTNNFPTSVTLGTITLPAGYSFPFDPCSGTVLTASNSCFLSVNFSPTSATAFNGNISVPFSGSGVTGSPFTAALQGTGSAAVVANPNPMVFQFATINNTSSTFATLTNGSSSPATITGISSPTGANAGDFTIPAGSNFCPNPTALAATSGSTPGGQCFFTVNFLSSTAGDFSAQFTVSYSIGGVAQTPITVPVSASIAAAQITISPNPLIFPAQTVNTQSQSMSITISNSASATAALQITSLQINGNDFAIGTSGSNCFFVTAGQSCTIPITFTPSQASGTNGRTGTLTITDNAATTTQVIPLQGTGVAGSVSASPTTLTFPLTNVNVGSSTAGVILSNTTGSPVTFNGVTYTGPYSTDPTGSNACATINPVGAVTGNCVVYIKFSPSGVTNAGTATIHYGATGTIVITLSGPGSNPIISVSPISITFPGLQLVKTQSAPLSVTLTNGTAASIQISSTPTISGDYLPGTNTCTNGITVAAGSSCTVNVIFNPSTTGTRTGTLTITDSGSPSSFSIPLSGTGTAPATLTANAATTPQSVAVNTAFPVALQATVKDSNGNVLPGVSVTFTVTSPSGGASGTFTGTPTSATVTTNSNGVATAPTFTANNIPGGPYTVAATAGAVGPANFSLTNSAGTPVTITATSGAAQSVAINTAFASLQATVLDKNSQPLDGIVVTFTAPSTGASGAFAGGTNGGTTVTATTNTSGVATASTFTANGTAGGPYNVTAVVGAVGPANFSLTNLAGAPASITAAAGTPQSAVISTGFATNLAATVKDNGGNLLSGVVVTFTAPSSGASGTFTGGTGGGTIVTATTGPNGVATAAVFTANSTVGTYTVNASVSGVATKAAFSLNNTAGPAANITASAGTPQNAAVTAAFTINLAATVTDSGGNPISGATVTFTAPSTGASGTFTGGTNGGTTVTAATNASGVATASTFTANSSIGSYSVTAAVGGVAAKASFSLTNIAGPPANIAATAGTPQSATISAAFSIGLQATVTDAGGNPVNNATVTFTAPVSGASGTFVGGTSGGTTVTATTNASGVATAAVFTANTIAGAYTVNASVTGVVSKAAFSLSNNAGAPASITATAGTPQAATIGTVFTANLAATVKDASGNLVNGATVTFTSPASGASGTFVGGTSGGTTVTATTNASGVATAAVFTANTIAGVYTVNASVTGVATKTAFSLTNNAGAPASITATAGTPQAATISTVFTTNLAATVRDASGNVVNGVSVTFTAPSTGASGTFTGGTNSGATVTATTNASGVATAAAFTANKTAGSYTVNATVTGAGTPAAFSMTNNVGAVAAIAAAGGASQSAAINTAFAALQATVTDSGGNGVSGVSVTFTVTAATGGASGTFTGGTNGGTTAIVTTGANGIATAPTFTANSIAGGPYTVAAKAGSIGPANFSLTNLSAPPASILATTGSGQSAQISSAFTTNLQATVNDSGSHPIAGVTVTFTAPASGASGTFTGGTNGGLTATAVTNASGVASAPTFTANSVAGGPYNLQATAGTGASTVSVNFSLTNLTGPAASVTATGGATQSVVINTAFATLQATVKDSGGNPVNNVAVTFTAPTSGASGAFTGGTNGGTTITVNTNASGVANAPAFTANTVAGPYVVNASVTGVSTKATYSLTNLAGPVSKMIVSGGGAQSVAVNTAFAALAVTVTDGSGNGVSGVSVTFTAPASGASGTFAAPGSGATVTVTTNASGVATAPTFTSNNTVGGPYLVAASASGLTTVNFSLTNLAGTPASITVSSGSIQSVAISTPFAALVATVKDNKSNPLSGVVVTFTAPSSGASGTFAGGTNGGTSVTATTDSNGNATASTFTANATAGGPYIVTATAGAVGPANFSLTNLAGAPTSVTATVGASQSAVISTAFTTNLGVTVKDNGGNLLSGVVVTFTAPSTGASGKFTGGTNGGLTVTATTGSNGVATAPVFTANSTVGAYTVNATVSGIPTPAAFSLNNTAGPAANIAATAGTPQTATISTVFATALQATVTDSGGNPINGASVTFTAPSNGPSGTFATPGTGATATVTTNASGVAIAPSFTANATAGAYTVNASVSGVTTKAAYSLTNNAGPPASISATLGTPQNSPVTIAFTTNLRATVKDSGGNPVSGATVTFTAPSSGASGTFTGGAATAQVKTDASGNATAPTFTANATGGSYSVTASVTGVSASAIFSLTNTVAPDVTISKTHPTGDFIVGSTGVYTIKVTNNGTGPTTGTVTITDTLPTGLTFVSGTTTGGWSCTANGQAVTCTNATVGVLAAKGGNSRVAITVSIGPNAISSSSAAGFQVTNMATVSDPNDAVTTDKTVTDVPTNIDNAVPTQSSISPSLGLIAGATSAQQITLTGTGFNSSTQVTFGSNPALTGTANAAGTSLTITVPVADLALANAGNVTIGVTNPKNPTSNAGGGAALTNATFPLVGMQSITPHAGTPNPVPIVAGTPTVLQVDLNLTPAGAMLPADVTITCSFLSALTGATCSPSPATIAHGTAAANATTMITMNGVPAPAGGSSKSAPRMDGRGPWSTYVLWLIATVILSMLGMLSAVRQRALPLRRAPAYLTLALLVLAAGALVGCTKAAGTTPTPTGPSTITVTATTADGATVSTTVNITISN